MNENSVQQVTTSNNPLFLLFISLVFVLLVLKFRFTTSTSYSKLPPSPPKLPFIGNAHQLIRGSLHHALYSLSQKHGALMFLHLVSKPTLVISSANMAREVMKTYDHVFASRPQLAIPSRLLYGKDVAFAPYGEYWRQVRKICVLQLLSAKKVQSFRVVREEEVALAMDKIQAASSGINLSELFVSLLSNVVCRVVLGGKYERGEGGKKFRKMIGEFTNLLGVKNIEDLAPSLGWINNFNGLNTRVEKNFNEINSFLDGVVEEHLRKKRMGINGDEEEDIVDIMLRNEEDSTLGIPITREATKAVILGITLYVLIVIKYGEDYTAFKLKHTDDLEFLRWNIYQRWDLLRRVPIEINVKMVILKN